MMNEDRSVLQDLIGQRAIIWSRMGQLEAKDEGILEAFDSLFVRLRCQTMTGEALLYFPLYNVRLIKPMS